VAASVLRLLGLPVVKLMVFIARRGLVIPRLGCWGNAEMAADAGPAVSVAYVTGEQINADSDQNQGSDHDPAP
jgi:hypothetical protein